MATFQTGAVIMAEIPVVSAAGFSALAWWIQRLVRRVDDVEDEYAEQAGKIGTLDVRVSALERITDSHDRRIGPIGENLAGLVQIMERHERWHERHDHPAHRDPPE